MSVFVAKDVETGRIVGVFKVEDLEEGTPNLETATAQARMAYDTDVVELYEDNDPEDVAGFSLKQARNRVASVKETVAGIQKRIDAMLEVAGFKAEMELAKACLTAAKTAEDAAYNLLRDLLLSKHEETGDKTFKTGSVGTYTTYTYDPDRALHYVVDHKLYSTVKLDAKAFQKLVDAVGEHGLLKDGDRIVAETGTEPRARIKSDLSTVQF